MIARLIMASPLGRAVRWLADAPELTLDQRIGRTAEQLRRQGFSAISALAAAEAVETGREHGLNYDRLEFDGDRLTWWGIYETRPRAGFPRVQVKIPLERATESTQRGVGSTN